LNCAIRRAGRSSLDRVFAPLHEYTEGIRYVACIDAYLLCDSQQQRLLYLLVIQNSTDGGMVDVRTKFVVKRLLALTDRNYEDHDELKYVGTRQKKQERVRV
jgi:hypothetical protein